MARVKTGTVRRRRHKRVLDMASGYYGGRHRYFSVAKESVDRALVYAYRDRKVKKREFRKLWIARINAALHTMGLSYSAFMGMLKTQNIMLDRKVLADLAVNDAPGFAALVASVKA